MTNPRASVEDATPIFSREQVEHLKRVFPQRSPQLGESYDQLRWRGGQCSVIEHIEALYKAQNETTN
jgi:hypothetical protein